MFVYGSSSTIGLICDDKNKSLDLKGFIFLWALTHCFYMFLLDRAVDVNSSFDFPLH